MGEFTIKQDGVRVCVETDLKDYTYPKYIFTVFYECGFSYEQDEKGILFIHTQDVELKVLMSVDNDHNWHHLISYRHSKWTLTYEGDVEYHVFANDVLKMIRRAFKHWHGL